MVLKIENLDCRIASTNVLRSCSLEVDTREVVCLIGRNGAGKSSILKSIIGLYPSQTGKIIFNDREASSLYVEDWILPSTYRAMPLRT